MRHNQVLLILNHWEEPLLTALDKEFTPPLLPPPQEDLGQRLQRYPKLSATVDQLPAIVGNAQGDIVQADEAEERLFEDLRRLGQQALLLLHDWAERKEVRLEAGFDRRSDGSRKQKKDSSGTVASGSSN